jgi:AcrR family transcriptional regulator
MTLPASAQPYHHGNLRAALLEAAEHELVASGIEGFSLRSVAKRAGVSHAAPAHHFRDANGLLTALAAISFRRFLAAMEGVSSAAGTDPIERLVGSGIGYIRYASANPALFDLLFLSDRPDRRDPEVSEAGRAAFVHLETQMMAVLSDHAGRGLDAEESIAVTWAVTHGLAGLFGRRASRLFSAKTDEAREDAFRRIIRRVLRAL